MHYYSLLLYLMPIPHLWFCHIPTLLLSSQHQCMQSSIGCCNRTRGKEIPALSLLSHTNKSSAERKEGHETKAAATVFIARYLFILIRCLFVDFVDRETGNRGSSICVVPSMLIKIERRESSRRCPAHSCNLQRLSNGIIIQFWRNVFYVNGVFVFATLPI